MDDGFQEPRTDLRAFIAIVGRHLFSILLILAITVGTTLFFTARQPRLYTSSAKVLVKPTGIVGQLVKPEDLDMATQRGVAASNPVAERVRRDLGLQAGAASLLSGLETSIETDTQFIEFSYTAPEPEQAQRLAQAFATAYVAHRSEQAQAAVDAVAAPIKEQLKASERRLRKINHEIEETRPTDTLRLADLNTEKLTEVGRRNYLQQQLLPLAQAQTVGGEIVEPATLPTTPSSPSFSRNVVLAIIVGLSLGFGVAFLRDRLDDRLRGAPDLAERVGAPVLAAIPHDDTAWADPSATRLVILEEPKSAIAEAYRTLRTNLQYASSGGQLKVVAITSPALGEGKTTTVANLVVALAQAGKRVVALSCDLRRPQLHKYFHLRNSVGVSSVLNGTATPSQCAQTPESLRSLRVLSSGPVPDNPAELLGSPRMDQLLLKLRDVADFVVIDLPPVLAVSDSLVVAPKADGVIVLADPQVSSRGALEHVRTQLEQVGATIAGCVLNHYERESDDYYGYEGYYYYPGDDQTDEDGVVVPMEPERRAAGGSRGRDENLWKS